MDRQRLTITLKKSLLSQIDGFIDGTKIRNRSHAIENLINQSISPKVKQAVILAGGKGLNMRPFTYELPKGMFPVSGKPILEHIIEMLVRSDIRELIFSVGHLGDKIEKYFGNGKRFGVHINYIYEKKEAGIAGALALTQKFITGNTFLVIHGDIMIDIALSDLISYHKERGTVATIALTSVVDPSSFGEVALHGSRITRFTEKPKKGKQSSQLINCGLYVFEKNVFDYIPKKGVVRLEDIFTKLATLDKISGFIFGGRWVDVGTPSSYEYAIKKWTNK